MDKLFFKKICCIAYFWDVLNKFINDLQKILSLFLLASKIITNFEHS